MKVSQLITIGLLLLVIGAANSARAAVKVGALLPFTGPAALLAEDTLKGMELRLEELGWSVAGQKLELVKADSALDPATGLTQARRLVERDRVNVVVGPISSAVALAVKSYFKGKGVPYFLPIDGMLDDNEDAPFAFRTGFLVDQSDYTLGKYAAKQWGFRTAIVMGPDYVFGRSAAAAFKVGFEEEGGKVIQEVFPPLGAPDFAPFLTALKGAEVVYVSFFGGDAIRFVQQWDEFGMKRKMKLVGHGDYVDNTVLPAQKDAAVGLLSSFHYNPDLDLAANRKFVAAYKARYGKEPSAFSAHGYVTAEVIARALQALRGKFHAARFVEAAKGVQFDAPWGPFRFDAKTRTPFFDIYIQVVEKQGDRYYNKVLDTIKAVAPVRRIPPLR